MSDEWVLVPVDATEAMLEAASIGSRNEGQDAELITDWDSMLAARPAIPRSVWDAMVERGAARVEDRHPYGKNILSTDDADNFLRAALGNPKVEGDET